MEKGYYTPEDLSQFEGKKVTREALLGRNCFYLENGKLIDYNSSYRLADFSHLTDKNTGNEIKKIREHIASRLYSCCCDEEIDNPVWVRRLPVDPEDCECEAYLTICLRLDDDNNIKKIYVFLDADELFNSLYSIPAEVMNELERLCDNKYLPDNYTVVGKELSESLRETIEEYSYDDDLNMTVISAYRYATLNISFTADENNVINDISCETEGVTSMFERPIYYDDCYADLMDVMIFIYDKMEE